MKNYRQPWSEREKQELSRLRDMYPDIHAIAEEMGRSPYGIQRMLEIIGKPFPHALEPWPAERAALLRHLWNVEGKTALECATILGVSRNAVIGKAHRMKLKERASPIKRRNNVVEVEFRGCQWIHNDPKRGPEYCGKTSVRYSKDYEGPRPPYCAEHLKMAYRPREKQKQPIVTAADKLFGRGIG